MTHIYLSQNNGEDEVPEKDKLHKIQTLRDMITNAEQTIQSAKAMLLQLEGKKKAGRKRKVEEIEGGSVVQGTFDGQVMVGADGKRYPVPANYASKSKLVQGDMLKLTITPDSSFIYKQIGPIERKHAIGIVTQDEAGNYVILVDGRAYRVLLASITYFRAEPGDEVAIILPRDLETEWAALDSVLQKGRGVGPALSPETRPSSVNMESWKSELKPSDENERSTVSANSNTEITAEEEEEEVDATPVYTGTGITDAPVPVMPVPTTTSDESENDKTQKADRLRQSIIDEWIQSLKKNETASPQTDTPTNSQ